jgi:signal transduction histidine kinase
LWDPEAATDTPRNTVISLFGGTPADPADRLRSEYEHQIREAAKQEERNRLARDLHDSIKQEIFVIQTAAATIQARFDGDPAGARQALDQVRASARQAMTEMEVMLDQLRAVPLENASLIDALKQHCEALGFRTGARVDFKFGNLPPSDALPPGGHEVILRVAQEALANIGRHARASNVLVSLDSSQGRVELRIRDDGAGFDPNQSRRGHGLENMRTRASEFGGQFELASKPGGGTTVTFSIPHGTSVEPGVYRRKAIGAAVVLVGLVLLFTWTKAYAEGVISVLAAMWLLRFAVAYRRAVKRREVAR